MVRTNRRPSDIMTRAAFLNAIRVNSAIGGSTNAPVHLNAMARHIGVELTLTDWEEHGADVPLLRSEEHTSELQSLMRISYAVFCLKKKKITRVLTHVKIRQVD